MGKFTLVVGTSLKPSRHSFKAAQLLRRFGHPLYLVGTSAGFIDNEPVHTSWPEQLHGIDTITLYLNPLNQAVIADRILALNPKRIVFNPGTENDELAFKARNKGIEAVYACTLTLLNAGRY